MNSDADKPIEEKYVAATELIWKIWWLSFYLILSPGLITLALFFILTFLNLDIISLIEISILIFLFLEFFFYVRYDKYRKNPLFKKYRNSLITQLFLLQVLPFIPIILYFIYIPFIQNFFIHSIILIVGFNLFQIVVYYYKILFPIDYYNLEKRQFDSFIKLKVVISKPSSFIFIFNYLIIEIFLILSIISNSPIFNLIIFASIAFIFFLFDINYTKYYRKRVLNSIEKIGDEFDELKNSSLLIDLMKFKERLVLGVTSFLGVIFIQLLIVQILINWLENLLSIDFLIQSISLIVLIIFGYLKVQNWEKIFYHYQIKGFSQQKEDSPKEDIEKVQIDKFLNQNFVFSLLLLGSLIFSLNVLGFGFSLLNLFILLLFILIFYSEYKKKYLKPKSFTVTMYLVTFLTLGLVSFIIIPQLIPSISYLIMSAIFAISLYFSLEIFVKLKFSSKEKIRLVQNALAILSFFLISFSFYPYIISEQLLLTSNPIVIFGSRVFLFLILLFIALQLSIYRLKSSFTKKSQVTFYTCVLLNFFCLDFLIFSFLGFRLFFILNTIQLSWILLFLSFMFVIIFASFNYINSLVKIIPHEQSRKITYYSFWATFILACILLFSIPVQIFLNLEYRSMIFLGIFLIPFDLLLASIFLLFPLKYGISIEKVKRKAFEKIVRYNNIAIFLEILSLNLFLYYFLIQLSWFFSIELTLIIMSILLFPISKFKVGFNQKIRITFNFITLFYNSFFIFYISYLFNFHSFLFISIPLLFGCLSLNIPLFYIRKLKFLQKSNKKILILNNVIISGSIISLPSVLSVELLKYGILIDLLTILNLSFLISYGILLIVYSLKKFLNLKKRSIKIIFIFLIIIEFIYSFTVVLNYSILILNYFNISFLGSYISLLIFSIYLYIPIFHTYKVKLLPQFSSKLMILGNTIFFILLNAGLPYLVYFFLLEQISLIYFLTLMILFLILDFRFVRFILNKLNFKKGYQTLVRVVEIINWLFFCFTVSINLFYLIYFIIPQINLFSYSLPILFFFILNLYNVNQIRNLKETLQVDFEATKLTKLITVYLFSIIFGIFISISFLLTSSLILTGFLYFFPNQLQLINLILLFIFFSGILLPIGLEFLIKKELTKSIKKYSSSIFKINSVISLLISLLIGFQLAFINQLHLISYFGLIIPIITLFPIQITIMLIFLKLNITSQMATFKIKSFYYIILEVVLIFLGFIYLNPTLSGFLTILVMIILLSKKSKNIFINLLNYILITLVWNWIFIYFIIETTSFSFNIIPGSFQVLLFLFSFLTVLGISVLMNLKKNNFLEQLGIISLISLLIFITLLSYTQIELLYIISISLLVFLFLFGWFLYYKGIELYKWFIRPGILLFILNIGSWISYSFIFISNYFQSYNPILTFTLTLALVTLSFIILYNDLSGIFRKYSYYIALTAFNISVIAFLYFLSISYLGFSLIEPIIIIILLNLGIFLCYTSIAFYYWKISWIIWKIGWWLWLFVPIVNFYIIYNAFIGIDILTNSLTFFGTLTVEGSLIITIVFCSLLYLPVLFSKLKKYFSYIILFIWGESLFLVYWICQNLFFNNLFLVNLSFFSFSIVLLAPIIYKLRLWKLFSLIWIGIIILNLSFLTLLFFALYFSLEIIISIDCIVGGLLFVIYSFFPNIRSKRLLQIFSYFFTIFGVFLLIYFLLLYIILNYYITLNLSLMIMSGSLFSSKYLKLNKKIMHFIISIIFMVNFSLLVFFTLILIPNFLFIAICSSIIIFGGSLLVFNHYGMVIKPINSNIGWSFIGLGFSFMSLSFGLMILPAYFFLNLSIFSLILVGFTYNIFKKSRLLIFYLIPIPLSLSFLDFLLFLKIPWLLLFFYWIIIYLSFFELIINIFNYTINNSKVQFNQYILYFFKNQKRFFLLNQVSLTILITYISFIITFYTSPSFLTGILNFFNSWFIQLIFILIYSRWGIKRFKITRFKSLLSLISLLIYAYLAINFGAYLSLIIFKTYIIIRTFIIVSISSLILFLEISVLDRYLLKFLQKKILKLFTGISWIVFYNSILYYFYLILNPLAFFTLLSKISLLLLMFGLGNIVSLSFIKDYFKQKQKWLVIKNLLKLLISLMFTTFLSSTIMDFLLTYSFVFGISYWIFFFQDFTIILIITNRIIFKAMSKIIYFLEVSLYISFQIFFGLNWVLLGTIYNIFNPISFFSLILIELGFTFILNNLINKRYENVKIWRYKNQLNSILILCLYGDLGFLLYSILNIFIGIIESLLITHLVILFITILELQYLKRFERKITLLIHTIFYLSFSLILFIFLFVLLTPININLIILNLLIFVILQFRSNHLYFEIRKSFLSELSDIEMKVKKLTKFKKIRINTLGLITYFLIGLSLQRVFSNLDPLTQILILSVFAHFISYFDALIFKFAQKAFLIKIISWLLIIISFQYFIIIIDFQVFSYNLVSLIPFNIFTLILELFYLGYLVNSWKKVERSLKSFYKGLGISLYLNFATWPLFFITFNLYFDFQLIILSLILLEFFILIDNLLHLFSDIFRNKTKKIIFLMIIFLIPIDLLIYLEFYIYLILPLFNHGFNYSISGVLFIGLLSILVRPFERHSLKSLFFWFIIFILLSSTVFYLSLPYSNLSILFSSLIFSTSILLYPFIFLLEELRNLLNKFISLIMNLLKNMRRFLKLVAAKLMNWFRYYYIYFWIFFSILVFIALSSFLLFLINLIWYFSLLIGFGICLSMIFSMLSRERFSNSKDKSFKRRIFALGSLWISVDATIFNYVPQYYYISVFLISMLILGSIILPFIYYKEKGGLISIKWRFYTTLFFIIVLVLTIATLLFQFLSL